MVNENPSSIDLGIGLSSECEFGSGESALLLENLLVETVSDAPTESTDNAAASTAPDQDPPPLSPLPVEQVRTVVNGAEICVTIKDKVAEDMLWRNSDGDEHMLRVYLPKPVPGRLLKVMVDEARQKGKILVVNDNVETTAIGNDRVRALERLALNQFRDQVANLHTSEFLASSKLKTALSLIQSIYHPDSKYAKVALNLAENETKRLDNKLAKYYAGTAVNEVIVIPDAPVPEVSKRPADSDSDLTTPPAKKPKENIFWNPACKDYESPRKQLSKAVPASNLPGSSGLVKPKPLKTVPKLRWPAKKQTVPGSAAVKGQSLAEPSSHVGPASDKPKASPVEDAVQKQPSQGWVRQTLHQSFSDPDILKTHVVNLTDRLSVAEGEIIKLRRAADKAENKWPRKTPMKPRW